ncbi:MAG: ATP-binding protein [Thermodesulforhabdaceae bacterium]
MRFRDGISIAEEKAWYPYGFVKRAGEGMHEPRHYIQLRNRIFLITVCTSLIPIALVAIISGYQFHTAYKSKTLAYLSEYVQKHAQNIDAFLANNVEAVKIIAQSNNIEQLGNPDHLNNLLRILQSTKEGTFVDLGFIRDDGFQISYAGPFKFGMAFYGSSKWFQQALQNSYYISDVFLGLRGIPHFATTVRIEEKGRFWVLRATIDFATFTKVVENLRFGETGEAFILNYDGELQTSINRPYPRDLLQSIIKVVLSGPATIIDEHYLDIPVARDIVREDVTMVQDGSLVRLFTKKTFDGKNMIYVAVPLKTARWILIYTQWDQEVFKEIIKARVAVIAVSVLCSIAFAILSWRFANHFVERIKEVDREKDIMNEQIIEAGKLASLGELAAGIAHEINNPVAIMVEEAGWIEDCLKDLPDQNSEIYEEIARSAKQIKIQGSRCKEITYKLLTFARRTDSGEKRVSLNDLLKELAPLCEQRARYARVKVELKLERSLPDVALSATEMQQVIFNLVNNAIDAMEVQGGGVLTMSTKLVNDWVVLEVSDTGPGIPKSIFPRIFEPFFTTKPVGKGTGLGLPICYGIIKKAGGNIEVESELGRGTTFRVWLPPVETPTKLIVGALPEIVVLTGDRSSSPKEHVEQLLENQNDEVAGEKASAPNKRSSKL